MTMTKWPNKVKGFCDFTKSFFFRLFIFENAYTLQTLPEAFSEPCQLFKIERFAEIVND